jgi:prepilin-type processing-associated H-X9-DG protein
MEKLDNNGEYLNGVVEAAAAPSPTKGDAGYNHSSTLGYTSWIGQPKGDWKRFTTRHRNGGMLLYADGHVVWHLWTDIQFLANDPTRSITNADGSVGNGNKPGVAIWNPLGPVN